MGLAQERHMIETLISVVIYLIIAGLIWWAVTTILGVIPLPEPIKTVVNVIMIVILCLIVIFALLPLIPGGGHVRLLH
jgi:hypothetical protein